MNGFHSSLRSPLTDGRDGFTHHANPVNYAMCRSKISFARCSAVSAGVFDFAQPAQTCAWLCHIMRLPHGGDAADGPRPRPSAHIHRRSIDCPAQRLAHGAISRWPTGRTGHMRDVDVSGQETCAVVRLQPAYRAPLSAGFKTSQSSQSQCKDRYRTYRHRYHM